jgi:metal-sulfur cluster biosynthetic enzyme
MTAPMIDEATIRETLRQVVDPELDCNIVDLGLIYGIAIDGAKVTVAMTLTTPRCPMHESIAWGVQSALLNLEGVEEVDVQLVWERRRGLPRA